MSNKSQLQTNNDKLSELIQTLQTKGSGGSGTSVETCTVTITGPTLLTRYGFMRFVDSQLQSVYSANDTTVSSSFVMENVVCDSLVIVRPNYTYVEPAATVNGTAELLDSNYSSMYVFKAPSVAGESCTINIYDDD